MDKTRFDWPLASLYAAITSLGLFMVTSASWMEAGAEYGDSGRYLLRQGMGVVMGLICAGGILLAPAGWIRRAVWPGFALSLVGLLMVLTPLAHTANGATRWFKLGPINVQPSEFAKIALVLTLAHYLALNEGRLRDIAVLLVSVFLVVVPIIAVLPQKDFGTTVIFIGLGGVLMFIAGLQWRYVITLAGAGAAGLAALIAAEPYRMQRLVSFLDPFEDSSGAGYQVVQGWIALATGGVFGQGFADGVAQRGFLPEAHTDFISAVVGEELGAVGWSVMVVLLLGIVWRALVIASRAQDLFGMLVATGLAALLGAQCIINLGVVGGVMPNKGLVLPFMSYGASAILAHTVVVGLLLRVSLDTPAPAPTPAPTGRLAGAQG